MLAPGTYGTVKVEYVVNTVGHDNDPDVTVNREYKNVTFTAGKVKWMRPDFRLNSTKNQRRHLIVISKIVRILTNFAGI